MAVTSPFYLIEVRDSDGNNCTVYDVIVSVPTRESALDAVMDHVTEMYPDDEPDGGYGTFHACDCHLYNEGSDGDCSHGGVLIDDYNVEIYATRAQAMAARSISHVLVDLTNEVGGG